MSGRSVGAVLAGLAAVVILSTATDAVLHSTGVFPPSGTMMSTGQFLVALAYRIAYGAAGGYIAARLAPSRPIGHALVLGGIGFILSIAGAAATWNRESEFGPRWYPLALVAIAVPSSWAGGKLGVRSWS